MQSAKASLSDRKSVNMAACSAPGYGLILETVCLLQVGKEMLI